MKKVSPPSASDASRRITAYIAAHDDWRVPMLARIRKIVLEAIPGIAEDWKWGTPHARFMRLPGCDRHLDLVAVTPDGRITAYVNGWIDRSTGSSTSDPSAPGTRSAV